MPTLPPFAEPGTYIRYIGPALSFPTLDVAEGAAQQFIRLGARMTPLKYPFRFANVAAGESSRAQLQSLGDLELLPKHIGQLFIGVSRGARLRVYHPQDTRILKWDQATLDDAQERDTANIEYEDSPHDKPRFEMWLSPTENFVPAFDAENVERAQPPARRLNIDVMVYAALFQFQFVDSAKEPDVHEKLKKFQIPSRPVSFGGKV